MGLTVPIKKTAVALAVTMSVSTFGVWGETVPTTVKSVIAPCAVTIAVRPLITSWSLMAKVPKDNQPWSEMLSITSIAPTALAEIDATDCPLEREITVKSTTGSAWGNGSVALRGPDIDHRMVLGISTNSADTTKGKKLTNQQIKIKGGAAYTLWGVPAVGTYSGDAQLSPGTYEGTDTITITFN